jgi:hypothetical protein
MKRVAIALVAPLLALQVRAPAAVTIPFDLVNHHVVVKATVNTSRPLSFVLDTGASQAIVRSDVAKALNLTLAGGVTSRGAGPGVQAGHRVRDATWSLVGLEGFVQPVSLALPLAELPPALGMDLDGIIGGEFIRQFVLELDYQARVIRLHDPSSFTYSGRGETLPLEFTPGGHAVVTATVTPSDTPVERKFMLDIGSGLALALHSPFVREHHLPGPQAKTIRVIGAAGAGGRSAGRLGRVAALQIGSFTIRNPIALFSEDTAGAFADTSLAGNIGAQVAARFRTFFDYGRRRIILEPAPTFGDPFDRAFAGIAIRADAPGYHTFRVNELLEDSPAADAGLEVGDIITSIDGVAAAELTLTAINDMLEKPVARQLIVKRGDRTIPIALTPKRLI